MQKSRGKFRGKSKEFPHYKKIMNSKRKNSNRATKKNLAKKVKNMAKLVRLGEKSYAELSKVAGGLQMRAKRVISLDEAVGYLCARACGRGKTFWKKLRAKKENRGRKKQKALGAKKRGARGKRATGAGRSKTHG